MRGTAAKRDGVEREIIAAAEALGAVVLQVSGVGLPDTLVLHEGRTYLVEVKRPGKALTHAQALTFARIHLSGVPVYVVETPQQMRALLVTGGGSLEWFPSSRRVEGQATRKHRPGYDRARVVDEFCVEQHCPRSKAPGTSLCEHHLARSEQRKPRKYKPKEAT